MTDSPDRPDPDLDWAIRYGTVLGIVKRAMMNTVVAAELDEKPALAPIAIDATTEIMRVFR